jgi:two-component system sensor histidine kinase YesM
LLKNIFPSLTKTGLLKKVIVVYIVIIVIPSALIGIFIYNQFYNNMLKDYVKQKQQIFDEYYLSMKSDLLKIQGVSNLYQYNTNVTDYLACKYNSDLDSVYNYIKFIKPIYDYVYSSIPFIKDIKYIKAIAMY